MQKRTQASASLGQIRSQRTQFFLLSLTAAGIYLYLNLFVSHETPVLLTGDQVYFWMDAQRLLHGDLIYRDFFRYTLPGTDLLYAGLFRLLGLHVWVTNIAVLMLGVAFSWLCYSLSSKYIERRVAMLTTALFLVFIYGKALNGTNHWFAMLAVAGAVNVSLEKTTLKRLTAAGALLGLGAFFNQAHGSAALVGFALFLICRQSRTKNPPAELIRNLIMLSLGFSAVLLLLSAYFIATVGFKQLWYCAVTYVLSYPAHNPNGWSLGLPGTPTWRSLPKFLPYLAVYIALPIVYCTSLLRCWRQRNNTFFPWDRVALLSLVGFFLLLEVAVAVNWLRLYGVSLPGVILLMWILSEKPKFQRRAVTFIWPVIIALAAQQIVSRHSANNVQVDLAGGHFATSPQTYEKLHWIASITQPRDLFLQAGWPGMYIPLGLRNPLYVATVDYLDASRPGDIELSVSQMKAKQVEYVLWTKYLDSRCNQGNPCNDYLFPFREYVHKSYTCVHVFPDGDTLWRKNG
jgi:hypothetical protein